jgi:hypothetical protein
MIYTSYKSIAPLIQPGDGIYFQDTSLNPISKIVSGATHGGPTHSATVRLIISGRVQLVEDVILRGVNGVQNTWLDERLEDYGHNGNAWWCPISREKRKGFDWARFYSYIESAMGRPYDVFGLFEWFARDIVHLDEDNAMFCSAFLCSCWQAAGLLPVSIDYAAVAPQDLVELQLYAPLYYQILGTHRELTNWNTRPIPAAIGK